MDRQFLELAARHYADEIIREIGRQHATGLLTLDECNGLIDETREKLYRALNLK
jgi:hypothetical protein